MSKLYVTTVCDVLASQKILSGMLYIKANIIHRFMTKIRKWEKCRKRWTNVNNRNSFWSIKHKKYGLNGAGVNGVDVDWQLLPKVTKQGNKYEICLGYYNGFKVRRGSSYWYVCPMYADIAYEIFFYRYCYLFPLCSKQWCYTEAIPVRNGEDCCYQKVTNNI